MVTNTTVELVETGEQRDRIGRRITPAARLPAAKRRSAQAKPPAPPVRFLAASLPASASAAPVFAVCVRLPDGTELRGQSGRELAELLRVLRK